MAKYKVLKSVAHNTGHSFLSDMNFVGTGRRYTMVPEHLYRRAQALGQPEFHLDLITGDIRPSDFATPELVESAGNYRRVLLKQISSQGAALEYVAAAVLTVVFDLSQSRPAKYERDQDIPVFTAEVRVTDDRGQHHVGRPTNWWRE